VREIPKTWDEFWAVLFRVEVRRKQIGDVEEYDRFLAKSVADTLRLTPPARVLDLACGPGDQALAFAKMGFEVVGVDIARSLVDIGSKKAAEENLPVKLICGDMRDTRDEGEFDAAVILSGSFGFFNESGDRAVLENIARALKPGGRVLLDSPNYQRSPYRTGFVELDNGVLCEEACFDPETCTAGERFFFVNERGEKITFAPGPDSVGELLRMYTVPEYARMFSEVGLSLDAVYGGFGVKPPQFDKRSKRMIVVGSKTG
jgi:SAM-dependent methyltransferase